MFAGEVHALFVSLLPVRITARSRRMSRVEVIDVAAPIRRLPRHAHECRVELELL